MNLKPAANAPPFPPPVPDRFRRASRLLLIAVLAWAALRAALYMGYLGGYRYQVESREDAQVRCALVLKSGLNPWGPDLAVQDYSPYGILYPAALALMPGLDLRRARDLSLAALLMAAFLVGLASAWLCGSALGGAAAGFACLGGYLFYVTPTARCDAFAALFFAAPLALLALAKGASRGLPAVCALLAALAFFAKPYAAASGPLLCLVLALEGRRRAALGAGLLWAAVLLALVVAVERAYPGYLAETFFLQSRATSYRWDSLVKQTGVYSVQALPLLILAGAALWRFRPLARPVLAWTGPALALALLMLWLGWNSGAFMTYYFQLLHPCAALAAAALWRGRPRRDWPWLEAGLVACAALNVSYGTQFLPRFERVNLEPWRAAERMVARARFPLLPPLLDSLATDLGKPVFDNGSTEYLRDASRGPSAAAVRVSADAWAAFWAGALRDRKLDLVLAEPDHPVPDGLLDGYVKVGTLALPQLVALNPGATVFSVYRPASGSAGIAGGGRFKEEP